MKDHSRRLTGLVIEASDQTGMIRLNDLHRRLNVIVTGDSTVRDRIRRLIGCAISGHSSAIKPTTGSLDRNRPTGWLAMDDGLVPVRLNVHGTEVKVAVGIASEGDLKTIAPENLFNHDDQILFHDLMDVTTRPESSQNSPESLVAASRIFARRFGARSGTGYWNSESDYRRFLQEAAGRAASLETRLTELSAMQGKLQEVQSRLALIQSTADAKRRAEQEISSTHYTVQHLSEQLARMEEERDRLDHEIARIEAEISAANAIFAAPPQHDFSRYLKVAEVLGRIDEIDRDLDYWHQVQSGIQSERVRLRDEAARWTELSLDHDEHPYHTSGELIEHVDSILSETQSSACRKVDERDQSIELRFSDHPEAHKFAGGVSKNCDRIRSGLRTLCGELENQYRHVRHRATVAEMRQLRRCFDEISAILQELNTRRQNLVADAVELDPELATRIESRENEFFQLLRAEGYESARRIVTGEKGLPWRQTPQLPAVPTARIDRDGLRHRLAELVSRRQSVVAEISSIHDQLITAKNRLQSQTALLDQYRDGDQGGLEFKARTLTGQIDELKGTIASLHQQVSEDRRRPAWEPGPALTAASSLLNQLSAGNFVRFDVVESSPGGISGGVSELVVVDRHGNRHWPGSIDDAIRRDCRVALAMVAQRQDSLAGRSMPLVMELAGSLNTSWIGVLTGLLEQQAITDHQVILLCDRKPVLSGDKQVDRTDLFRLYDLNPRVVEESSARIISWQPVSPPVSEKPVVYNEASAIRSLQLTQQPAQRLSAEFTSLTGVTGPRAEPPLPTIETTITEETLLRNVNLAPSAVLRLLQDFRIHSIGDLLEVDPARYAGELRIDEAELDRIQAAAWLLVCVPGLSASDASLLVECGVVEPEQLESTSSDQLLSRLLRHLEKVTNSGRWTDSGRYNRDRILRWYRGLESTRDRWRRPSGYSRRMLRSGTLPRRSAAPAGELETGYFARQTTRQYRPGDRYFEEIEKTRPGIYRSPEQDLDDDPRNEQRGNSPNVDRRSSPTDRGRRESDPQDRLRKGRSFTDRQWNPRDRSDRLPVERDLRGPRDPRPERNGQDHDRSERIPRADHPDFSPRNLESREPGKRRNDVTSRSHDPHESAVTTGKTAAPSTSPAAHRNESDDSSNESSGNMKFYLNLDDSIEAAPSIGPRTAERFEKIGIRNIRQFLQTTADSMAERLNYKRITAEVLRQWQDQSRLVCRIPNLRGHDAQLLVACGVNEPEKLEGMSARQLLDLVGPFSDTKEGLKIIRSGKKPDLEEVTDWLSWSQHMRSLNAA